MNFKMQHIAVVVGVLVLIYGGYYFYNQYHKSISTSAGTGASGGKHPLNEQHGTIKAWLNPSCPWCQKQVKMFEEENIVYEAQEGSPPEGDGVPQCQSSTTGKVCVGYKDAKGLEECLQ